MFFTVASGLDLTVVYADADPSGNPIGLASILTTGSTTTTAAEDFTVTLRHEPDKGAAGVKDGDITNAGGETDVEATFPVEIQ